MTTYSNPAAPILNPSGDLAFTRQTRTQKPRTVGTDGAVYCADGTGIARTSDAFASVEQGADFAETVYWVARTAEGYVVITHPGSDVGKVYFSESFGSGFTLVNTMRETHLIAIGAPVVVGGSTYLFVGEYNSGAAARKLWRSADGGQTWTSVRTMTVNDAGVNAHWHAVCYEPATGRVFASAGDAGNTWLGYSDDLGTSWTALESGGNSTYFQPTVLLPLGRRVFCTPDTGPQTSGVDSFDPQAGKFRNEHEIAGAANTWRQFGNGPQAVDGDVAYITFPPRDVADLTLYIAGTGDAGRTWQTVHSRTVTGYEEWVSGIVGPDVNGKVYMAGEISGTAYVDVADALTWS